MSCLGCTAPKQDSDLIRLDVGPLPDRQAFNPQADLTLDPSMPSLGGSDFRIPLRIGNEFSPGNWSDPEAAGRFNALDLATPMPVRSMRGDMWSAEVSFSASSEQTGLGLDIELAPRAQIERNRAGNNIARTGAEVRLGQNLTDRDLRGVGGKAPSWYFFVGADNEALIWNVADRSAMDGASLRDQATVGDLQVGVAWSLMNGGQMSFGLVERKLKFNDIAGDNDIDRREQFAAFSFTLHH